MNRDYDNHIGRSEGEGIDFAKSLMRQRKIITYCLLGAISIAFLVIFLVPKKYKIDSLLEIGTFPDNSTSLALLESPEQVIEKIVDGNYAVAAKESLDSKIDSFPKINAQNPDNTNLVQITLVTPRPQVGKEILGAINTVIIAEHQKRFDAKAGAYDEGVKILEKEVRLLEAGSAFSAASTLPSLVTVLSEKKMALAGAAHTVVAKEPSASAEPINQKPLLTLLLALFVGFFVGVFSALAKEWWIRSVQN